MSSVNPLTNELLLKIVYYGPGLSGKTTALTFIHRSASAERRGKMVSLATPVDRTLYFDLVPPNLPKVGENRIKLQLFTVPGQVHYNATRKLVLTGTDGVVFVADSLQRRMDANVESLTNLRQNLADREIDLNNLPLVFHYNKRDLTDVADVRLLEDRLNPNGRPAIETCAITGQGIQRGLEMICKEVITNLELQDERTVKPGLEFDKLSNATVPNKPTLQPPRSRAAEPASRHALEEEPSPPLSQAKPIGEALSFVSMWRPEDRDRPQAIERSLAAGRDSEAAQMISQELERLLVTTGHELSWSSPAGMISLLGLDGRCYLEVARVAARAADGKSITREQLLRSYLFLVQVASVVVD